MGLLNFMKKDDKKSTDQAASSSTVQTTTTTVPSYNPAAAPAAPVAQPPVQTTEVVTQVAQPATSSGMSGGYSGMSGGQSPAPVMTEPQTTTVQLSSTETVSPNGQAQQSSVAVSAADGTAPVVDPNKPADPNAQAAPAATNAPTDPKAQKNEELDLMTHLTQRSNRVFVLASGKAKEYHNQFIDSEHMLFGLLSDSEIYKLLSELKVQPQNIEAELKNIFKSEQFTQNPQFSPRVKRIIDRSLVIARQLGYEFISPEHMLVSLVEEQEGVGAQILKKLGLKPEDLNKKVTGKKEKLGEVDDKKKKNVLTEFTINLTEKAAKGLLDPVVERAEVIERVIHILSRRTKNNPALTGEAGVGKTAVVEGLAQRIASRQVPESLLDKQILQLDLMSMLAGASHRGEFEQRMKDLIEQVQASEGHIILFIDEIHNIVGAGSSGEGSMDAGNFLKPALARGEIQLIGATTITEYRKYIEKDPALERRFQPIFVPEPTEEASIKMLKAIKGKYEAFHRVKIPDPVIEEAVKLSKRYVGDRFLPDKAVDLIDEAASAVRLPMISLPEEIQSLELRVKQLTQEHDESQAAGDHVKARIIKNKCADVQADLNVKKEEYEFKKGQTTTEVTPAIIKDIVARWTGIPVSKISESEVAKLSQLEEIIHERMIGQEEAVGVVSQAVRRGRAGLKSNNRPIGSFIFLGPTGVGKTELAKTLAEILFGQEEAMIRLDMTEFMEKHEVAKLLGAPPGYVGYEEGGKLTEAVRRKPYSVVLFDEVEKAHPDIFNILLQILDDGRLTDNKGHVISFKNAVVICTSNIGTKTIQTEMTTNPEIGKDKKALGALKEKVMNELLKFFRPELVNRFDEVIVFEPLSYKEVEKIVKLQIKALIKLLEDQQMSLEYTEAALEEIARLGYDPVFGARPLRRTIQKMIENPISTLIIKGDMKSGDVVSIDYNGTEFTFKVGEGKLFEDEQAEKKIQYMCLTTNKIFETVIIAAATVISPYCGSSKVRPLTEEEIAAEKAKKEQAEKVEEAKKAAEAATAEGEKVDGEKTDAKTEDAQAVDGAQPAVDPNAAIQPEGQAPVDPSNPNMPSDGAALAMPPAATPENMSLPVIGQPSVGTAPQSQPPQTMPPAQNGNAMSAGGTSPQLMVN
jgi:ATP-dependent Clp protease ATP-binding subunit ClpC